MTNRLGGNENSDKERKRKTGNGLVGGFYLFVVVRLLSSW